MCHIRPVGFVQSHNEIEPALPLDHLRHDFPVERSLNELADVRPVHAVERERLRPQPDVNLVHLANWLDHKRTHAWDPAIADLIWFAVFSSVSRSSP